MKRGILAAALLAGTGLSGPALAYTPDWDGPSNVMDWWASCNGTSDDSAAFNAAESDISARGGGILQTPNGATCALANTVTLHTGVTLLNKGTIVWTGGAAGPMFATSTTAVTNDYGMQGGVVNVGTTLNGSVFALNSGLRMTFRDIAVVGNIPQGSSNAPTVLDLHASVFPHDPAGTTNLAYGMFDQINAYGNFGTCIRLRGEPATPDVNGVTLNRFVGVECFVTQTAGVDFQQWADTNIFFSFFTHISGPNSSGIIFNSASPTNNVGIYQNIFYGGGVDTGVAAGLNRNGILVNWSFGDAYHDFAQYPVAENGAIVNPNNYDFNSTEINAGNGTRNYYPGRGFLWQQPLNVAGAQVSASTFNVSVVAATGLGATGTASIISGNESYFQIQLNAQAGAAADGTVETSFTPGNGVVVCIGQASNGSGGWTDPTGVHTAGVDGNHTTFVWHSALALTAGLTYAINANCHRICTSGGASCL